MRKIEVIRLKIGIVNAALNLRFHKPWSLLITVIPDDNRPELFTKRYLHVKVVSIKDSMGKWQMTCSLNKDTHSYFCKSVSGE